MPQIEMMMEGVARSRIDVGTCVHELRRSLTRNNQSLSVVPILNNAASNKR
jgi:hypothetical protein